MHKDHVFRRVMRDICKSVNSSKSLATWMAYQSPRALKDLTIDPALYDDHDSFSKDYLVYSIARKYEALDTGLDLEKLTINQFFEYESQCARTNIRLREWTRDSRPDVRRAITLAQRKIQSLIGVAPTSETFASCKWSGGATASNRRGTPVDQKMSESLTVTTRALDFAELVLDESWRGNLSVNLDEIKVIDWNVFHVVPKTAFIGRGICAEPSLNAFMQQGVGQYLRRELKKVGVDLNDQSVNQKLAAQCHERELSTLDLRGASDSLAHALVDLLLPPLWVTFLESLRSPMTYVNGIYHVNAKFSSMGNAFTFELESLVFWALVTACRDESCADEVVAIYGDDIICPRSCAPFVVETLEFCGFSINTEKSFISGRFFESCGKHYFDGHDVTPIYQKEEVETEEGLIRLHNRLIRYSWRQPWFAPVAGKLCKYLVGQYPGAMFGVPRVPYYIDEAVYQYPSDDGFLTEAALFEWSCCGKTTAMVLGRDKIYYPAYAPFLYAYKLRRGPLHSNDHPRGWDDVCKVSMSPVLRRRSIWLSALIAD